MRFMEFSKPKTGRQLKIDSLNKQKEIISTKIKSERNNQKKQRALDSIKKNNEILSKINNY